MTKRERERRRRAKHRWQKAKHRENVIADAEKRLGGGRSVPVDIETGGIGWYRGYTDIF